MWALDFAGNKVTLTNHRLAMGYKRFVPLAKLYKLGKTSITDIVPGVSHDLEQTIVFIDLRGFTSLSERLSLASLHELLANYWTYTYAHLEFSLLSCPVSFMLDIPIVLLLV
jgi:hypothetical protein